MSYKQHLENCLLLVASLLVGLGLLAVPMNLQAEISQKPLSLTEGVAPNLILTLDDSGSMRWAFAPDLIGRENSNVNVRNTRRGKSYHANPMYYNPNVTYRLPYKIDSSGNVSNYTTSFTNAYQNGFKPAWDDVINLRNNYKVSWNYDINSKETYGYSNSTNYANPTGRIYNLAENPSADFSASVSIGSNNTTRTIVVAEGVQFRITRTKSNSCTATATLAGISYSSSNVSCSGSNGNFTATMTKTGVPAYYYEYNESLPNCPVSKNDDRCYELRFVSEAERENFAIWYSFYRNRALATVSAANIAFNQLSSSVRLTWQSLGNCTTLDSNSCGNNRFQSYSATHRKNLLDWLAVLKFDQSTPLRASMARAGEFLKTDKAWLQDPQRTQGDNPVFACRAAYHVLMTDGMWNGSYSSPSGFRHDKASFDLPDGTTYPGNIAPFADSTSDTLADVAMHYWANDLRSELANELRPYIPYPNVDKELEYWDPRNNPATWQHMSNFIVGLALTNSLNHTDLPWEGSTFAGPGYAALKAGTKSWPPAADSSDNNVYDLWHAAINSRGEFFSVDSPDAMVEAFEDILGRIAMRTARGAPPASQLSFDGDTTSSFRFQSEYSSEDWSGDLKAEILTKDPDTGAISTTTWSAADMLPAHAQRNIKMASSTGLQDFTWTNASSTLRNFLHRNPDDGDNQADARGELRLNYLRGDSSNEGEDESQFRVRNKLLGDIIGSQPVVVRGARYLASVANRIEKGSKYENFVASNSNRPGRVYVGGNDGMLHAFDAKTGVETFAFVPTGVFSKLNKLVGKNYLNDRHEFYVDGAIVVADAYIDGAWRTVLVGSLGAGGKGLFALDITTPGSEKLLWEFSDSDIENGVTLGYTLPKPTIARLHNGKWAVVTGNGYQSANHTNGKAALLIIDLETGGLIRSLEVQGTNGTANGLSTPVLADFNGDGIADHAYAGDLQGNLWRFDLTPTDTSYARPEVEAASIADNFKVAFNGQPVFKATGQPITAAPSLFRISPTEGYVVVFGTGKFFEIDDKHGDLTQAQSVYGIKDQGLKQTSPHSNLTRAALVKQEISTAPGTVKNLENGQQIAARILTNNPVDWKTKNGWYLDLKLKNANPDGEMVIEDMVSLGKTLFLQTLTPNHDPCESGASTLTYAINPLTGGRTVHHAFVDIRNTENLSEVISVIGQEGEGGLSLEYTMEGGYQLATGNDTKRVTPDPASIGRQSWRVIEGQ